MIEILKGKVVPQKVKEGQDTFSQIYNPDVLLCLANLSNDEVFTPPEVANQMLDLLPKELFEDPNTKFLDPACKSGVFLREIAKRLIKGLEDVYPDLEERIDHICKEQLYGIAITELTSLLSRRSVYCSKYPNGPFSIAHFDNVEGNIRFKNCKHEWEGKANVSTFVHGEWVRSWRKCKWCGASEEQFSNDELEYHAYEFIHKLKPEEIFNMKFDVIISNPPYALETGSGGSEEKSFSNQAKPLYHMFVEQSKKLNPRFISMIIPARWYNGGIGLTKFRNDMINDNHIVKLVDYVNSRDCFQGVRIPGGVCYFLWERESNEDKCEITNISGDTISTTKRAMNEFGSFFIRSNDSIKIIYKVRARSKHFLNETVSSLDTFGLPTHEHGHTTYKPNDLVLIHSKGYNTQSTSYIERSRITKNTHLIDKYKVKISRMIPQGGEVGIQPENGYRSISTPQILQKNEVDTFSYLNVGFFDTEEEAKNFRDYLCCKFTRFMLRTTYSGVNVSQSNFVFVPQMDMTRHWSDNQLYEYFGLDQSEIDMIEQTMRPMDDIIGGNN